MKAKKQCNLHKYKSDGLISSCADKERSKSSKQIYNDFKHVSLQVCSAPVFSLKIGDRNMIEIPRSLRIFSRIIMPDFYV